MDDGTEEQAPLESPFLSRQSTSRGNEQANEEGQLLWSLYRKHASSTDSDRDSDASDATSDGSVQWEKNFIDKLVKVKKHSCLQERTSPASEDTRSSPTRPQPPVCQRLNLNVEHNNCQLNFSEEQTPKLNEDTTSSPESHEPPLPQRLGSQVEPGNCQLNSSEEGTPKLNEQLPECSKNSVMSSSCGSSQMQGAKRIRRDIRTEDHTHGELNLGYVSRWEKKSPRNLQHHEICLSSGDSESDEEHERRRERQNQAGTSESEKITESPRNWQFSSSCESDSDDSGFSNLCLRVSEDSMEDDTDHSSGREKRNKSHETSADRKDAVTSARHKLFQSVESVKNNVCEEVPTRERSVSPPMRKKRSVSHPRQQTSYAQLYSNQPSHRPQQWTRDSLYRSRSGRLKSQSPTDEVGRWRRSQSPVEPCRKLRSRSVLPIRDTQCVTRRKRRSKSCETVSRYKKLHDSQQPSKEHVPFGGIKLVSEAPSNNRVKRRSRSRIRRWSKSTSVSGRHKTSSSSRNKSMLEDKYANSESLSVGTAERCIFCNCSPKLQEEHTVPASKYALVTKRKSHVNQRHLSETGKVSDEQLTPRMRRSLSRSRIISDTVQKEYVTESAPTKLRRSMSEVLLCKSEKEESLKGGKERVTRQSMLVNTSERNKRMNKKEESLKEHGCTTFLRSATADEFRTNKHSHRREEGSPTSIHSVPVNTLRRQSRLNKFLEIENNSTFRKTPATADKFRTNKHSHRSEEGSPTSTSIHSVPVNTRRRQSHLNKFLEIENKSTFRKTPALLIKSSDEALSSKCKKVTDNHVADSSCLVSGTHTKSKKCLELVGNTVCAVEFKGFPEEEVTSNSNLSLPAIASENCDYPISTESLHQVNSTRKTRHSRSVITNGTLLSESKDKKASELLGSSDRKRLLHCSSSKRKISDKDTLSQEKLLTSTKLFSSLSGSHGKETELYISEDRSVEKHPSHERCSLLRTSVGCESQYNSNSHPELGLASAVVHASVSETPHSSSKGECHSKSSRTSSSLFKCANAGYDATASDTTMVKCNSQEGICCKEDNTLSGTSKRFIKPCSVVLKNLELSSGYDRYANENEKFVFPPFPRVASLTRVRDFCLPEEYMNTMGKKASEMI